MIEEITNDDLKRAGETSSLPPHYFTARRVVENAMKCLGDEEAKAFIDDLVKDLVTKFTDRVWDVARDSLWSDTEMNLHGQMWHTVDDVVRAILGKRNWAVERYVLGSKYDCDEIRAKIAALVPKELQDSRVADLEDEVGRLREQIKWLRP